MASQKANNLLTLNGVETGYVEPLLSGEEQSSAKTEAVTVRTDRPTSFSYGVSIYPNPATEDHVTFTWDPVEFTHAEGFTISVNDIVGRVILTQEVDNIDNRMEVLDVSGLLPGTYILQLSTESGFSQSETLIVQ
ncbi:MAG: T9SS type A sorting domain-containing protein [Flavobacteriia bacterium]|nr:T9SS type A sorting domain-containing protein [Flavobacteriia bacterium]